METLISGGQATPEPTPETTPEPTSTPIPDDYIIDWIDPNLEAARRASIQIYDRDIMYGDVKDITVLDLGDENISDISVLSNLTNLTDLYLIDNPITDYSPPFPA